MNKFIRINRDVILAIDNISSIVMYPTTIEFHLKRVSGNSNFNTSYTVRYDTEKDTYEDFENFYDILNS